MARPSEVHDARDDQEDLYDVDADADDVARLLPDSELIVEQIRNELGSDLIGQDLYTSTTHIERSRFQSLIREGQSKIINCAIDQMGMGRYQWELFVLAGFGWAADNLWLVGLALVLPSLSVEWGIDENSIRYTTMILFIGLGLGALTWGHLSDVFGRRLTFNSTLLITWVFGIMIAFGPNWSMTALLFALMGFGVGGSLPVDGAMFLEALPRANNGLLTLLSAWWPLGQLISAMIAWYYIPQNSCQPDLKPCFVTHAQPCCESKDNRGWRYFIAALGIITLLMFVGRFFLFKLMESPKFLLSRNRTSEAVEVVQYIARYNGAKTWLTEKTLDQLAGEDEVVPGLIMGRSSQNDKFSLQRVYALFETRRLGITTILLWIIWLTIGWAYPLFNAFLPQYLEHAGRSKAAVPADVVYFNYLITSVAGLPGSFIAAYTVDLPQFGRKGTMAVSTFLTAVSLFIFTVSGNSAWQTFAACLQSLFSNVMYGVIYAYTPEVFPAPVRGTGSGIASLLNRLAGITAPLIAAQMGKLDPSAPIWMAASLYLISFAAMCLLPIETRGMQSL